MQVLIAEKPSVARDIARLLGADEKKEGYLEGNGWQVTWAFGHLVGLAMPAQYGYEGFRAEHLPMLPDDFMLVPAMRYDKDRRKSEPDPGLLRQLKVIDKLFRGAERIVVATDAGREGELIFRYIYQYLGCRKPFHRLWISSLTDSAIQGGLASLKPGSDYDNLYYAAKARSESDWLVGLNATQALTIGAGVRGAALSLGRVQTPTLAMICERYLAHKNFRKAYYYILTVTVQAPDGTAMQAVSEKRYDSREAATAVLEQLRAAGSLTIRSVVTKDKIEGPPLLYDLSALQQEANRKYDLSAEQTLEIAQSLYERKLITYPRTGSRYIGDDVFQTVPALIRAVQGRYAPAAEALAETTLSGKSVNGEKVTDHHALLPTGVSGGALGEKEQWIYDLVTSRMLEAFGRDAIRKVTTVTFDGCGEQYLAHGAVQVQAGWKAVRAADATGEAAALGEKEGEEADIELDAGQLPPLPEGENVNISRGEVAEKQTQPRPLFTEASLLKAMETAGRDIADEAAREAMKESGLGTPATRAAIIERLLSTAYIERKAKKLVPTDRGLAVYALVRGRKLASPELTGSWEKLLSAMVKGSVSYEQFMEGIRTYTTTIVEELLASAATLDKTAIGSGATAVVPYGTCPKCGKGEIYKGGSNAYCSRYKEGCDFKIWLTIAEKKLPDGVICSLLEKGRSAVLRGFRSKAGKAFEAALVLKPDFKIAFDFPNT